ncbi:MAG TPA: hypothetical protein VF791_05060 [Pyrinomonadaceae bacterium]
MDTSRTTTEIHLARCAEQNIGCVAFLVRFGEVNTFFQLLLEVMARAMQGNSVDYGLIKLLFGNEMLPRLYEIVSLTRQGSHQQESNLFKARERY